MAFHKHSRNGVTRTQHASYGKDWWSIQAAVRKRDGYCCTRCHAKEDPRTGIFHHVHHIKKLSAGGLTTMSNLRTLCEGCHGKQPGHSHMHVEKPALQSPNVKALPSFLTNPRRR